MARGPYLRAGTAIFLVGLALVMAAGLLLATGRTDEYPFGAMVAVAVLCLGAGSALRTGEAPED